MTDTTKTPIEYLREAKAQLLEHGWSRSQLVNPDTGCLCALGGLAAADLGHEKLLEIVRDYRIGGYSIDKDPYGLFLEDHVLENPVLIEVIQELNTTLARRDFTHNTLEGSKDMAGVYSFNDGRALSVVDVIVVFDVTIARLEREQAAKQAAVEVLETAKKRLEPKNAWTTGSLWHRSRYFNQDCYCALGAIASAVVPNEQISYVLFEEPGPVQDAVKAVSDVVVGEVRKVDEGYAETHDATVHMNVYRFNDRIAKGADDVIQVFDEAINNLKG
ncbi:hypothetical protein SEA_NEDARYA_71 [Gordonia phage Nedarya]|nr:hypothetical protein SEA_NEDARYA_71 [Gordonia phage Nedarya]